MDYGLLALMAATTCYWFYKVHCRLEKIWTELDKLNRADGA